MRASKVQKQKKSRAFLYLVGIFLCIPLFLFSWTKLYPYVSNPLPIEKRYPEMTGVPPELQPTLEAQASTAASFVIPILMYHYVEIVKDKNDTIRQSLTTSPNLLIQQIKTLKQAGYTFLTMATVGDILLGKTPIPSKPVVLTFDDGYRDFYTDVLPILKKENVKAVAYIVPGFYDKPNYMYRWQIYELANSGLVEIGAHTVNHVYLKGLTYKRAQQEITQSKLLLEDTLHIPIVSFAYPYGTFDQQAINLVKEAGFTSAVSTIPGIHATHGNRFFLYRLRPGGRIGPALRAYLQQLANKKSSPAY